MTDMTMGANVAITVPTVRATLRWSAGPGVPEVDASALLLGQDGRVGADADLVFYNQPRHPSGAVSMAGKTGPPRAADAIALDLARVPGSCLRVVLAASAEGGTFGQVPGLSMELADAATGSPIALFPMRADAETAFVCAEIYRRDAGWRFRAVGQGYASGLAGLATDFGIDVGGDATASTAATPGPTASTAPAPAPSAAAAPAPAVAPPAAPGPPPAPAAAPAPSAPGRNLLDLDAPL